MGLGVGIVGLPNVGKSTTFNALTKAQNAESANYPFCTIEPNKAIVPVPDARLEELAKMRDEGIDVPKVVIMPGVSNGPPATMEALNEELYWIYQNYILISLKHYNIQLYSFQYQE